MNTKIENNFSTFKADFKNDTGLEVSNENMPIYLAYYNARVNDINAQINTVYLSKLSNKLDHLPNMLALDLSRMITNNISIKQLLQKLP